MAQRGSHAGVPTDRRRPAGGRGHLDEPVPVVEVAGLSDEVLLGRATRGERLAFAELFRRHQDLAWRTAYAGTLSTDDAVATVVEAFVHLHRGVAPESVSFRAFLAALVRDAAQDRVRRRRSVRPSLVSDEIDGDRGGPRPGGQSRRAGDAARPTSPATPAAGPEVDLTQPADGRRDPAGTLSGVVPPPPPELWALVQVAYDDYKGL